MGKMVSSGAMGKTIATVTFAGLFILIGWVAGIASFLLVSWLSWLYARRDSHF